MTRTVLIISPHFPPSTLAGVHRARHLARRLPDHGWRPIVLRADERTYTEASDPELARLVPETVEQIRVNALPAGLTRALGVGDIGLRAYPYLRSEVQRLAAEDRPDVVLITGFPFYPMLMAGEIKRLGLPVVLDFQDPWVSDWGARQPATSKAGLAHRLALLLEPRALRHADFVTSVSEVQNRQLAARYPFLRPERMAAIPIGGEPDDFEALRRAPPQNPRLSLDPDRVNLSYVGAFLPMSAPLARTLFEAVADLRARRPDLAARLRLNFVGTSNVPGEIAQPLVRPIAEAAGVGDLVFEHPGRVPFLEALSLLAQSHGLMLIGSTEVHYTASKIYPALMSGRPFLSLFNAASSAHAILSESGGGISLAFADETELSGLRPALAAALERLAEQPQSLGRADPAAYADYTAHAVAGRFAAIFNAVVR